MLFLFTYLSQCSIFDVLIKIVWFSSSSQFYFLIFIKFIISWFRWSFSKFFISRNLFLVYQHVYVKSRLKRESILHFLIKIVWFSSSSQFSHLLFSDFHQVHNFLIYYFLIFIKFTSFRFRCNFLKFVILTKDFSFISACVCKIDIETWSWIL
jgi:hypothetical protein